MKPRPEDLTEDEYADLIWKVANHGGDNDWYRLTGHCGGCGEDCGCGGCLSDYCSRCPDRNERPRSYLYDD